MKHDTALSVASMQGERQLGDGDTLFPAAQEPSAAVGNFGVQVF